MTVQVFTATTLSIFGVFVIYRLAKQQKLSFRYAVGWISIFSLGTFAGLLLPFTGTISDVLNLSPSALLASGCTIIFLVISVQISISISRLQENCRILAEKTALLELELQSYKEH
jgi:hypothetical protein